MATAGNAPLQHGSRDKKRLSWIPTTIALVLAFATGMLLLVGCSSQQSYSRVPAVAGEDTPSNTEESSSDETQSTIEEPSSNETPVVSDEPTAQEVTKADRTEIDRIVHEMWSAYFASYITEVIEPAKASGQRATAFSGDYDDKHDAQILEQYCEPAMFERMTNNGTVLEAVVVGDDGMRHSVKNVTVWTIEELDTSDVNNEFHRNAGLYQNYIEEVLLPLGFGFDLYAITVVELDSMTFNPDTGEELETSNDVYPKVHFFGKKNGTWYVVPHNSRSLF